MRQNVFHQALRTQVLTASGIESISLENCRDISIQIFNKDKNYLSQKTLQKFFGLIPQSADPSPFLLDSMAGFIGKISWDQFQKEFNGYRISGISVTSLD
ncbi:hypothetical protein [Pedobacter miscanthi]|uniref:Uncharacterized protein n=1 Tax=Pedobacter miscanthi TaxID=2259170 RepID=A0A366L706_9SPHI|nr:hypothetical protein [Pedobacter miscanthi]RBQ08922.1 hypothetical protein DRW42_06855 [Pedobacter miscanthi]